MERHHSQDVNPIFLNTVENAVGKSVHQTAVDIVFENRLRDWIVHDILNGGRNFD
jgi:hypothetical protein